MIEGFIAPIAQQATGIPVAKSPPPGFPPLTPQDKNKFMKLFIGCGPQGGLLAGNYAPSCAVCIAYIMFCFQVRKRETSWSSRNFLSTSCLKFGASNYRPSISRKSDASPGHLRIPRVVVRSTLPTSSLPCTSFKLRCLGS